MSEDIGKILKLANEIDNDSASIILYILAVCMEENREEKLMFICRDFLTKE